jgi:hypothetical protein
MFDPKLPALRATAVTVAMYLFFLGVVRHSDDKRPLFLSDRWPLFIPAAMLLIAVVTDWLGQRKAKPEQYPLVR